MKAHKTAAEGSATRAFVDIHELKYFFWGLVTFLPQRKRQLFGDYVPPLCLYQVSSCQSK